MAGGKGLWNRNRAFTLSGTKPDVIFLYKNTWNI